MLTLPAITRPFYASTTALIPNRDELPLVLNRRGLLGTAVEVGVQQGIFSDFLLTEWDGICLISVDPWLESDDYLDISNVPQETQEAYYHETLARLAKHGQRSKVWRTTSAEASRAVAGESLDFVYLDARHDYDSVKSDLEDWYDKLRPGGIIAGHDYLDGNLLEGVYGVKRAVDEFFAGRGLRVASTFADTPWGSWVVRKPLASDRAPRPTWFLWLIVRATLTSAHRLRATVRSRSGSA